MVDNLSNEKIASDTLSRLSGRVLTDAGNCVNYVLLTDGGNEVVSVSECNFL